MENIDTNKKNKSIFEFYKTEINIRYFKQKLFFVIAANSYIIEQHTFMMEIA